MKVVRFDPSRDLIIVEAFLTGPRGRTSLQVGLDTGSSESVIASHIVDELGYGARHGEAITTVRTAVGKEQGYTLRVERLSALGFAIPEHLIHVFDLADGHGIDGLLGLRFLRHFDIDLRFGSGTIQVAPTAPTSS